MEKYGHPPERLWCLAASFDHLGAIFALFQHVQTIFKCLLSLAQRCAFGWPHVFFFFFLLKPPLYFRSFRLKNNMNMVDYCIPNVVWFLVGCSLWYDKHNRGQKPYGNPSHSKGPMLHPIINLPLGDSIYYPFIVILGMFYCWVQHITRRFPKSWGYPKSSVSLRSTQKRTLWLFDLFGIAMV